MKAEPALVWPDYTRDEAQKAWCLKHLRSAELAISLCRTRRAVVQAGGNIGLWPRRYARDFERVYTFEPEPASRAVLVQNVAHLPEVIVRPEALGSEPGVCGIKPRSLGSHTVVEGDAVAVIALDSLGLTDVDLLQLDIEGYEVRALRGALDTIRRSRPVIQVEMRGFTEKYGDSDAALVALLKAEGYREHARVPGSDVVFIHAA